MTSPESTQNPEKRAVPLGKNERRVLGVLVEKAKTTPDNYPMSVAAIVAGSNQKSNRSPIMQLDEDDVEMALEKLKTLGAAREIQGSGRVNKFRHVAYEWLGVDAAGVAIMTELLLRGPQTLGELRSRASRMHDFPDLESVNQIVASLETAGLVQPMTPPGRGQVFAHSLYPPDEQRYLAIKVANQDQTSESEPDSPVSNSSANKPSPAFVSVAANSPEHEARLAAMEARLEELQMRLEELEAKLSS
jgi:uncharacterized protein YceH (UPF0502 family)